MFTTLQFKLPSQELDLPQACIAFIYLATSTNFLSPSYVALESQDKINSILHDA